MDRPMASNTGKDFKTDPSIVDLLKKVVAQSSDIMTGEVALMKAEISEAGQEVKKGSIKLILSLIFVITGLCVALIGCASFISSMMPYWAACLVIGVPVLLIGITLLAQGMSGLKIKQLHPERTADSVQKDINVLKGENL